MSLKLEDKRIYLDNNSTTAIDPKAFEAMLYDLGPIARNPSCSHSFGQEARNELIRAKRSVAEVLNVSTEEIYYTSGASESMNFLLRGFFKKIFPKAVISCQVEHSCVDKLLKEYERSGGQVIYLPIDQRGAPSIEGLLNVLSKEVGLITLMAVNNETGVKFPIKEIAALASQHEIPFVVDGVALLGKEPFEIFNGISAMGFSSHKLHGPKGVGLTYLSEDFELEPLILGGNQQKGMRAGTLALANILGFSKAIEILPTVLPEATTQMQKRRDHFEEIITTELKDVLVNGTAERICNTSSLAFLGCDGEGLLMNLDMQGLAASHGSACSSGSLAPSRILLQMGLEKKRVESSLRFSLSRLTTLEEVERAASLIISTVKQMRRL